MAHPYLFIAALVLGAAALFGLGLPGDVENDSGPLELLPPPALSDSDVNTWCAVTDRLAEAHRQGEFFVHPNESFSRFVERQRLNPASLEKVCREEGVSAAEFLTWTREIGSVRKLAAFADRLEAERESAEIAAALIEDYETPAEDPLADLPAKKRVNLNLLRDHLEDIDASWEGLLHPHRSGEDGSATIFGS